MKLRYILAALIATLVFALPAVSAQAAAWYREVEPNYNLSLADRVSTQIWRYGTVRGYYDYDTFYWYGRIRVYVRNTGRSTIRIRAGRWFILRPGYQRWFRGGSATGRYYFQLDETNHRSPTYRIWARY